MKFEKVQKELVDTVEDGEYKIVSLTIKKDETRAYLCLIFSKSLKAAVGAKKFLIPIN